MLQQQFQVPVWSGDASVGMAVSEVLEAGAATLVHVCRDKGEDVRVDSVGVLGQGAAVPGGTADDAAAAAAGHKRLGGEWAGTGHDHLHQLTG